MIHTIGHQCRGVKFLGVFYVGEEKPDGEVCLKRSSAMTREDIMLKVLVGTSIFSRVSTQNQDFSL